MRSRAVQVLNSAETSLRTAREICEDFYGGMEFRLEDFRRIGRLSRCKKHELRRILGKWGYEKTTRGRYIIPVPQKR